MSLYYWPPMKSHLAKCFNVAELREKVRVLESDIQTAISNNLKFEDRVPERGRAVPLSPQDHPKKTKISTVEGRARLLHNLANIELQAMELSLRTLIEFPEAPLQMKQELAEVALDEGSHLLLCLEGLEDSGFQWGDWPIHLTLWNAVSTDDQLLDRLFIVHRYLEGSGLEAQIKIIDRLRCLKDSKGLRVVEQIHQDELKHVGFGSKWFQFFAKNKTDFEDCLFRLKPRLPQRRDPLNWSLRGQCGFKDFELKALERFRFR